MSVEKNEGVLYVVATPIGNLADITARAVDVLRDVDVIAAEDTRHTKRLLAHLGITTSMCSLHEHNEKGRSQELVNRVLAGDSVALVSDAGTPLISDPGSHVVRLAKSLDIQVVPVPGPSALVCALSACGLEIGRFVFEGFLPHKSAQKKKVFESYSEESKAVVFYESPHRILDTMKTLAELFPDRELSICRELTKTFETIKLGTISSLNAWMQSDANQQKGEFVLVLAGVDVVKGLSREVDAMKLLRLLSSEMPPKKACAIVSEVTGANKKELYQSLIVD